MKRAGPLGGRFWRMYAATATSDLADGIGRTALPLTAAAYTRNPVAVSGLVTFTFLPWLLFALLSGALVDRVDRRRALTAANLVRAAAAATLAGLVATHAGSIAALYAVAFVLGLAETIYDSAVRALLPQIVEAPRLEDANGLVTTEETVGQTFLGAPLGAALFAAGMALPFVLGAAGFVLAAALIIAVRGRYRPLRSEPASLRSDMAAGVRWLFRHRLLRGLTLISAGSAFAETMATGVLVLYVLEVLHLPAHAYGLVLLAGGIGAVVGGLATPPLARRLGRAPLLTGGVLLTGLATAAMALTRDPVLAGALFALSSAGVMVWNVLVMSLRQALIPGGLFGRVQGAYRTLAWGAIPLGALAGGGLASWLGLRPVFAVAGLALCVLAGLLGRLLAQHRPELA